MMDLILRDALLRNRPATFEVAPLSPVPQAASRVRARVLAVAHRRSALARADAALAILPAQVGAVGSLRRGRTSSTRPTPRRWRRIAALTLASAMSLVLFVGTTFAAQTNGPLYAARERGAAAAAQQASRTVLQSRRARGESTHPFYWAAFTASGE